MQPNRGGVGLGRRSAPGGQNIVVPSSARQTGTAASGPVMSCRLPRNVIIANVEQAPFAAHYESLPIGRKYGCVATMRLRLGVTLRDLIEREGEGS